VQITPFIDNQQQYYTIIIQIEIVVVEMGGKFNRELAINQGRCYLDSIIEGE
jgi:hypothetical protein